MKLDLENQVSSLPGASFSVRASNHPLYGFLKRHCSRPLVSYAFRFAWFIQWEIFIIWRDLKTRESCGCWLVWWSISIFRRIHTQIKGPAAAARSDKLDFGSLLTEINRIYFSFKKLLNLFLHKSLPSPKPAYAPPPPIHIRSPP